jgi:hypothetical protein
MHKLVDATRRDMVVGVTAGALTALGLFPGRSLGAEGGGNLPPGIEIEDKDVKAPTPTEVQAADETAKKSGELKWRGNRSAHGLVCLRGNSFHFDTAKQKWCWWSGLFGLSHCGHSVRWCVDEKLIVTVRYAGKCQDKRHKWDIVLNPETKD